MQNVSHIQVHLKDGTSITLSPNAQLELGIALRVRYQDDWDDIVESVWPSHPGEPNPRLYPSLEDSNIPMPDLTPEESLSLDLITLL